MQLLNQYESLHNEVDDDIYEGNDFLNWKEKDDKNILEMI